MRLNVLLFFVTFLAAASLLAVQTNVWQIGSFDQFLKGRFNGVSVTKDGELSLAPEAKVVFNPGESLALSLATDRRHNIYVGTGHQGKVFRVDADGKASLFFTAHEPDIFALAVGPDEALYVGSSPEGKIYRVTPDGKSSVFFDPRTKYIWALLFDSQGNLYLGTGDKGQILKVNRKGEGDVFFDSNQTHIMCLAFDPKGNLLAGSVPDGLIYRIGPSGKAFVIYKADLSEIHDIVTDNHGHIYAAALGTGEPQGIPAILNPALPATTSPVQKMSVTVAGSSGSLDTEASDRAKGQNQPPKQPQRSPSFIRPAQPAVVTPLFAKPKSRGALIEIFPDSTVQTLWSSDTESAYGLALQGSQVLFSTDSNGQIYELDPSEDGQNLTLLAETHESVATRLLPEGRNLYIATGNVGKLFRIGTSPAKEGTYESSVKDTKFISRWGALVWRGDFPAGSSIEFSTRSGNSDRPDQTWSGWSGPYRNPDGSAISSPPARYVQWKAVFHGTETARPRLDEVSVSYLNQNLPPDIRSLNVSTGNDRTSTRAPSSSMPGPSATINVTAGTGISFGTPLPIGQTSTPAPLTIGWQADDPNGDTLVYSLYVKATDEQEWHLLKGPLKETSYTIEPHTLADGKYVARLVASDEPSNPPATAMKSAMESAPFWVDNTSPEIRVTRQEVRGNTTLIQFSAEDDTSPLRSAEYSLDSSSDWKDILSDDGIVDSRAETFTVRLSKLKPGEHIIALRAYDSAGNAGVGKAVVEVHESGPAKP